MLAISWTNRGGPGNDSDGFAGVFGANAEAARNTAQGAIDLWQRVITNLNQSGNVNQLDVSINMAPTGTGFGGSGGPTTLIGNKPRTGAITLNRGNDGPDIDVDIDGDGIPDPVGDGVDWFLDPTPLDNSEYNNGAILNPFAALPNPGSGIAADFMTLITIEMAHVLGVANNAGLAWRNNPFVTNTNQADVRDAPGTLWTFDGPTVKGLLTSNNGGGGGGTDTGLPVHVAYPPNQYFGPTLSYNGVADVGTAGGDSAIRYLPSKLMVHMLKDVYGYAITEPAEFGTFHAMLQSDGQLRIRGGLPAGLNFPSSDLINVFASGANINVDMDFGNDVAGTGISGNMHSGFLTSLVSSIRIDGSDGDDAIIVSPLQSNIPVTVIGGSGVDTLEVGGSPGNDTLTATSFSLSSTFVNITSYSAELLAWKPGLGIADFFAPSAILSPIRIDMTTGGGAVNVQSLAQFSNLTINGTSGDDTITVGASPFASEVILSPVTVNGGAGNDTLFLGSNNGDSIDANVTFNGGANAGGVGDRIVFNDTAPSYNIRYDIAPTFVTRDGANLPRTVSYTSTEGIVVNAGSGADTVIVRNGITALVTANGNSGNDNFIVGGGNLNGFFPQDLNGGPGTDQITFDDSANPAGKLWDINQDFHPYEIIYAGLISLFTTGFESVGILAGLGIDNITFHNDIRQNYSVDGGAVNANTFRWNAANNYFRNPNGPDAVYAVDLVLGPPGAFSGLLIEDFSRLETDYYITDSLAQGFDTYTSLDGFEVTYHNANFLTINGSNERNTFQLASAHPDTLYSFFARGGNDRFDITVDPAVGGSDVRTDGNDGSDSLFITDAAFSAPASYAINSSSVTRTSSGGGRYFSLNTMESISVTGTAAADTFGVTNFSSGAGLVIRGADGDDTLNFGNGNLSATITSMASFNFDGQGGYNTFNLLDVNDGPGSYPRNLGSISYFNSAGTYNITLFEANTQLMQIYPSSNGPDVNMVGVAPGTTTAVYFNTPVNLGLLRFGVGSKKLTGIQGGVIFDGGANGSSISLIDGLETIGRTVHLTQNTLGAFPGDDLFPSGGSLTFTNIKAGSNPGLSLFLGSGADTLYVQPNLTAAISVAGGNPTSAPGDTLNLALAGAFNYQINGTPASGNVTSTNLQTLTYSGFETGPSIDAVAPTVNIVDVTPDPRTTSVASILIDFTEAMTGLNLADLTLTRNGGANLLPASATLTSGNQINWTLGNLAGLTLTSGDYLLTLNGAGSGIADLFGNAFALGATDSWTANIPPLMGDANGDNVVNIFDVNLVSAHWGEMGPLGDVNHDNMVNIFDINLISANWGQVPGGGGGGGSGSSANNGSAESSSGTVNSALRVAAAVVEPAASPAKVTRGSIAALPATSAVAADFVSVSEAASEQLLNSHGRGYAWNTLVSIAQSPTTDYAGRRSAVLYRDTFDLRDGAIQPLRRAAPRTSAVTHKVVDAAFGDGWNDSPWAHGDNDELVALLAV